MDINAVIKESLNLSGIVKVCWPYRLKKPVSDYDSSELLKYNDYYSVNNSTLCFVYKDNIYVTPYTKKKLATLKRTLKQGSFYVPFSNGDYPLLEKEQWLRMRNDALMEHFRNIEEECSKICDERSIKSLANDVLDRCFRIPLCGIAVKQYFHNTRVYAHCNESCIDANTLNKLGKYCSNNGIVVFIYRDGHTYVTHGYWIVNKLKESGFKESILFVPFSNGEQITDPVLSEQWEQAR